MKDKQLAFFIYAMSSIPVSLWPSHWQQDAQNPLSSRPSGKLRDEVREIYRMIERSYRD